MLSVGRCNHKEPLLVWQMMERLGIEVAGGALTHWSMVYDTARHRCESCSSKPACKRWLKATPPFAGFAPPFCPNADLLFELQVSRPGAELVA